MKLIGEWLDRESLIINQELGDGWALAYLLEDIGCLTALEDQSERGLILVGAASVLREGIGAPLSPAEEGKLETALQAAREALAEGAQAEAWTQGRALLLEDTLAKTLRA